MQCEKARLTVVDSYSNDIVLAFNCSIMLVKDTHILARTNENISSTKRALVQHRQTHRVLNCIEQQASRNRVQSEILVFSRYDAHHGIFR